MSVTMEHAQESDLNRIVEIYNSTVPSRMVTANTEPVSIDDRKSWFDNHDDRRPIFVFKENEEVIGWMSLTPFSDRQAYDGTAEVSIYLDEKARGKGLGQFAIEEVKRLMPTLEVTTLLALIFAHNTPSIKLFEKNNFKLFGTMPDVALMDGKRYSLKIYGYQEL